MYNVSILKAPDPDKVSIYLILVDNLSRKKSKAIFWRLCYFVKLVRVWAFVNNDINVDSLLVGSIWAILIKSSPNHWEGKMIIREQKIRKSQIK